jgi:RNA polymerase sigma factor for flagellar operon FliA
MATEPNIKTMERPENDPGAAASSPRPRRGSADGYTDHLDESEIIRQFVPFVKRLALRLRGRLPEIVQLDDLIQGGLIAVLRLARHGGVPPPPPDPPLQRSIVNAMIDESRTEVWAPVRTVRLAKTANEAMRTVKLRLGRDGSDDEIAAEMGMALADYHAALVEIAGIRLLHIDEFEEAGYDRLRATDNQDAVLDRSRMMTALAESIASLPEREKLVLSLYYEQELNMEEVGEVLGLDKSTVCRVHGRALLMLRGVMADWRVGAASPPGSGD